MRPLRHSLAVLLALLLALSGAPLAAQPADPAALLQAARAGDAAAQFDLAERFRKGQGVLQSYASAAELYAMAAGQDHAGALNGLGALMIEGLGVPADPAGGLALLEQAAGFGAPKHIHDLASALEQGIGTAPDPARAATLFARAAELGWTESAVSLGVLYQDGIGVDKDVARAIALYSGPAEAGHARAQNNLGLIHVRGDGVPQDYATAAAWFIRAAEQGLPVALTNLGVMYENGFGVERDEEEAKRLYRLAAERSDSDADLILSDPRLLPPDPAQLDSYRQGAAAGDPVAQLLLGMVLMQHAETGAERRQAAWLLRQAADRGLPAAMANLGVLSFKGHGVLQDYVEGYKWLTLAAGAGLPGAIDLRDRLASRMTAEQINTANERAQAEWVAMTGND